MSYWSWKRERPEGTDLVKGPSPPPLLVFAIVAITMAAVAAWCASSCVTTPEGRIRSLVIGELEIGAPGATLGGLWTDGTAFVLWSSSPELRLHLRSRAPELWTPPPGITLTTGDRQNYLIAVRLHPWTVLELEPSDPLPDWLANLPPFGPSFDAELDIPLEPR